MESSLRAQLFMRISRTRGAGCRPRRPVPRSTDPGGSPSSWRSRVAGYAPGGVNLNNGLSCVLRFSDEMLQPLCATGIRAGHCAGGWCEVWGSAHAARPIPKKPTLNTVRMTSLSIYSALCRVGRSALRKHVSHIVLKPCDISPKVGSKSYSGGQIYAHHSRRRRRSGQAA